jgi:HPt (histidine-containing phosphotransfer) domain-containing protein
VLNRAGRAESGVTRPVHFLLPAVSQIGNLIFGPRSGGTIMRAYESDPELRAEFARLQRAFLESAKRDVGEVLRIIDEAGPDTLAADTGQRLRTIAHGLRGAGGSYGFDAVTSTAGELEEAYLANQPPAALREAAVLLAQAIDMGRRKIAIQAVPPAEGHRSRGRG